MTPSETEGSRDQTAPPLDSRFSEVGPSASAVNGPLLEQSLSGRSHGTEPAFTPHAGVPFCLFLLPKILRFLLPILGHGMENQESTIPLRRTKKRKDQFLNFVAKDLDKLLPFREKSPSVLRARMDGGPFSSQYLRTREGFFSSLVFRTITYSSKFLFKEKTIFQNAEDYKSLCQQLSATKHLNLDDVYFCKRGAYGNDVKRSPANATELWNETAESRPVPTNGDANPVPFLDFYNKIRRRKPCPAKGEKWPFYVQAGALIGYLLTADYAYTGVVRMPSVEEVGTAIAKIRRGNMEGLILLGLLPNNMEKKAIPEAEIIQAFRKYYDYVSHSLTQGERDLAVWDPITAEHTLCKVSRWVKTKEFAWTDWS